MVQANTASCLYGDTASDLRDYIRMRLRKIRDGQDIDIDDVVQETYLRVLSIRSGGGIENPKGYLFRTAKHLIIDIGRRRKVQPFDIDATIPLRRAAGALPVVNLTPERYVSARQSLDIVMKAIDKLPKKCRKAFCLQRTTGKKYAEVATELQMSESMVQKHMARALLELQKVLPDPN